MLLTGILSVLIGVAALLPPSTLGAIPGNDVTRHLLAFTALAIPIAVLAPRWLLFACLLFAAYGGLIEIIQPTFGRDAQLSDWVIDLLGVTLGSALGLAARWIPTLCASVRKR